MNFARICILVVLTTAAVYFGLEHFFPHHKIELTRKTSPAPVAVSAGSPSGPPSVQPTTAAGQERPLTEAEARKIAEEVGRKVAMEVAQQALGKQSAPPTERATEQAAATSKIAAADENSIDAQPTVPPEPEHSSAKRHSRAARKTPVSPEPSAPEPVISRHKSTSVPEVKPRPVAATPGTAAGTTPKPPAALPPAAPFAPWWTPASQQAPDKLNLLFAGEVASPRAIALLFSSSFSSASTAGSYIRITDASGKPVQGQWTLAPNPRLLVFRVTNAGRYNVTVAAGLADAQGKMFAGSLHGPVDVH